MPLVLRGECLLAGNPAGLIEACFMLDDNGAADWLYRLGSSW